MAEFLAKVAKLAVADGPTRVDLKTLTNPLGYPVVGARFHHHATYGTSVIVDLDVANEKSMAFLPKRFGTSMNQMDIDQLASGQYRIRVTGVTNGSPVVEIFK